MWKVNFSIRNGVNGERYMFSQDQRPLCVSQWYLLKQLNERNSSCRLNEISILTFDVSPKAKCQKQSFRNYLFVDTTKVDLFIGWVRKISSLRILAYAHDLMSVRNVCIRTVARYSNSSKFEMRRCHQNEANRIEHIEAHLWEQEFVMMNQKKQQRKNNFELISIF